ncbi:CarboxypepD_reg-like domain-containing protein [Marivirga sericea]|jgi:hypothetical protein|uniref:CarboxypepD_reg-like domain-containing protein n=1 Tax=Marivirga sericea TaxID=1028 RepID=A0A1X7J7J5_9BACT|nr:carboxypeptidase-like regulatory domain-containing protein [Marivirga sericea]SMG22964.1 CarboxypepD_reg-like domain-containing protein [Marivirga sericea]
MKGRMIITLFLFVVITLVTKAQKSEITLSGIISCDNSLNEPLSAVHVFNKNTKKGTLTDKNGEFSISMKKQDTIIFSTVQHVEKIYTIEKGKSFDNKHIEITLEEDTVWLEAVTVMGFKRLEDFKQQILQMKLPDDDVSLALPTVDKYAKQNYTGDGQYEIRGPLTYLLNKIHTYGKRTNVAERPD